MLPRSTSISVIVPAYNVEAYINEAIDSLLEQSQPIHEIIIINDGSNDKTAECLAKYNACNSIKIIQTANQGLGPARNEGLRHATGEFVYFMDADDYIVSNFVDLISTIIAGDPALDLIFFSGEVFFDDDCLASNIQNARVDEFRRRVTGCYAHGLDAAGALLETGLFSPSACLYVSRRRLWQGNSRTEQIRFQPIVHEDDELITRLCARSKRTYISRDRLYMRRIRNGSIMNSEPTRRNSIGYFKALMSTWKIYEDTSDSHHRSIVLQQFRAQVWQYLYICQRIRCTPPPTEFFFLLMRIQHVPIDEFLRTITPIIIKKHVRRAKSFIFDKKTSVS